MNTRAVEDAKMKIMTTQLANIEGNRGEFRVTRQMLLDLPSDTYWDLDEWFEQVKADNPHLEIEAWREEPSNDIVFRWEPRMDKRD